MGNVIPYLTDIKCPKCRVALIEIPKSEPNKRICCIGCGAAGSYKEVMEGRGGLIPGAITQEEMVKIRKDLGLPEE